MKLYALHDRKAKAFSSFHVERSDAVASRGFVDAVLQPNSVFGKYPEDFELVSLCDVSQDYADIPEAEPIVGEFAFQVVLTAVQVIASQPRPSDSQIPLKLEA
ncbi:MAG: nonstructural protein [Microviridae sp.]|nr:MAG: nonstructural protein [Microviridae sp.]